MPPGVLPATFCKHQSNHEVKANASQTVQLVATKRVRRSGSMRGSSTGQAYATKKAAASNNNGISERRSQRSTRVMEAG